MQIHHANDIWISIFLNTENMFDFVTVSPDKENVLIQAGEMQASIFFVSGTKMSHVIFEPNLIPWSPPPFQSRVCKKEEEEEEKASRQRWALPHPPSGHF